MYGLTGFIEILTFLTLTELHPTMIFYGRKQQLSVSCISRKRCSQYEQIFFKSVAEAAGQEITTLAANQIYFRKVIKNMSLPEFPTGTSLTREEAINQIISSIAMEELGISHIINAEGEKLQYVLGTVPGLTGPNATIEDVLKVNESVRSILQHATESQSLLRNKLQNALSSAVLTGPTGPIGPTGPATIAVNTQVDTLAPGLTPTVTDEGSENNVILKFGLPLGATGPSGPTGPSGATGPAGLDAFGGIYNSAAATQALAAATLDVVDLPNTLTGRQVDYATVNSIIVQEAGTYNIDYSMVPTFSAASTIEIAVRSTATDIASTAQTVTLTAAGPINYSGNTIAQLVQGAIIDIAVTSSAAADMTFLENAQRSLSIFKLN